MFLPIYTTGMVGNLIIEFVDSISRDELGMYYVIMIYQGFKPDFCLGGGGGGRGRRHVRASTKLSRAVWGLASPGNFDF